MYYNEPQKLEYLSIEENRFAESTIEVAKIIFAGSAEVERQYDIDLSNFNRQQVVDLLKKYNSKSKGYYKVMCVIFSDYYNWCLNRGYVDESNFTDWYHSKISNKIIDEILPSSLLKDKFFLKEDVIKYLDDVLDPTNKLLLYAPSVGINGDNHEDLKYLRVDDLLEKRSAIQLHSGKIQIVDELFIELLKEADKSTIYYPEGMENFTSRRNGYSDSIYVFKRCGGKLNEVITNPILNKKMSVIRKQIGNKFISISTLYRNGLINTIKEHYEKQDISLYTAIFHKNNNKIYTYDKETRDVIDRYNSNITVRMLRMELKDTIEYYM